MANALLLGLLGLASPPLPAREYTRSRGMNEDSIGGKEREKREKKQESEAERQSRTIYIPLEEAKPDAGGVFRSYRGEAEAATKAAEAAKAASALPSVTAIPAETPVAVATKPAAAPAAAPAQAASPPKPLSLTDAKLNFEAVVRTHFADQETEGLLPFDDPVSGRTRQLSFQSWKAETLRDLGKGRYSALAVLREAKVQSPVEVEIIVDLSGVRWTVADVRRAARKGAKKTDASAP